MLAGRSVSVAVLVTVRVANSLTVWPAMVRRVGALFTSLTVTEKELVALRAGVPLSVTLGVNTLLVGPWASVGVQVMIPPALMVAVLVTVRVANSLTVWPAMVRRVGALFTSLTVTEKELVALRAGVPLSVTL